MTMQTITAERDVQLVKRSPLNPFRRLLRKRLPTYSAPLYAEALVTAEREGDMPTLRIEEKTPGRFSLAVIAKPGARFTISRVLLRERGAKGGYFTTPQVDHRTTAEEGLRAAGQKVGEVVALVAQGIAEGSRQGGVVKPRPAVVGEQGPEALSVAPGLSAAVFNPAWAASPAPTHDSTVLHDLQHVAELLETAQFEIAMTPGGDAAGSDGNSAWKALRAIQTMQQKLLVMAEAADEADVQIMGAIARIPNHPGDGTTMGGAKRNLNRARSMLRMVTDRLPLPPSTESKSV